MPSSSKQAKHIPRKRKPFSKQKGGHRSETLRLFREFIGKISGDEPEHLIEAYFTSTREGKKKDLRTGEENKLGSIISKIRNEFEVARRRDKKKWISILSPFISHTELKKKHGFNLTHYLYTSSKKEGPPNELGRKKISEEKKKEIESFLIRTTKPAPNRNIKISGALVPVRYFPCCARCSHGELISTHPDLKISYSKFLEIIPPYFKKAKKRSDLCPVCQEAKKARARKIILENKDVLTELEKEELLNLEEILLVHRLHKERGKEQREAFKEQINSLEEGEAVLLMDFKENVKLGGSPEEVSQDFYDRTHRTVFSVLVLTKKKAIFFDFLSQDLTHDSFFVIKALESVLNRKTFKNLNIKKLNIWSDGGKHFRNFELVYFYFDLYQKNLFDKLGFNFFVEYHGKNFCDSHFSVISGIISTYETSTGEITGTPHLKSILKNKLLEYQRNNNYEEMKFVEKEIPTRFKIIILPVLTRPPFIKYAKITNFSLLFSFQFLGEKVEARETAKKAPKRYKLGIKERVRETQTKSAPKRKRNSIDSEKLLEKEKKRTKIGRKRSREIEEFEERKKKRMEEIQLENEVEHEEEILQVQEEVERETLEVIIPPSSEFVVPSSSEVESVTSESPSETYQHSISMDIENGEISLPAAVIEMEYFPPIPEEYPAELMQVEWDFNEPILDAFPWILNPYMTSFGHNLTPRASLGNF